MTKVIHWTRLPHPDLLSITIVKLWRKVENSGSGCPASEKMRDFLCQDGNVSSTSTSCSG